MSDRLAGDWIDSFLLMTDESEPPLIYKEWVAISVIAGCLQRKCYIDWGDATLYPNMYIVLVGPAGRCRKGTAMMPGLRFLKDMGIKLAAESMTRQALIKELKNSSTMTMDPLSGKSSYHSSLTIYSEELTVFLGYNNLELISDMTNWFDCRDTWTYRTKNMGSDEIIGVYVNMIGATTPELIQVALPRDAVGGGLTSRIIFVYAEKKDKIVPAPFVSEEIKQLREALKIDLERICMLSGQFKLTNDCMDRYIDWYVREEQAQRYAKDPFMSKYAERRSTHLRKLSAIMCASRTDSMIVEKQDFEKALRLLDKTEKKMGMTFGGVGRNPTADITSRVMASLAIAGEITFDALMNQYYHDADKKTMQGILATLESMKYCTLTLQGRHVVVKYTKEGG